MVEKVLCKAFFRKPFVEKVFAESPFSVNAFSKRVFVVIPAFNEQSQIGKVISDAKECCQKVIVVDDGSVDSTAEKAKKAGAIVLKSPVNMGKGFALRQGVKKAISLGAGVIATIDADGQHNPKDILKAVKKMRETNAELVVGSRMLDKNMPLTKKIGNLAIQKVSNFLFGTSIEDTQSGFRVFKASAFKKIEWKSKGYEVESEIIMNAGKHKVRAAEIPIKTIYSDKYKGTSIIDGVKIVLNMLWWKVSKW